MIKTRRWFLRGTLFSGAGLWLGCGGDGAVAPSGTGGGGGQGGGAGGGGQGGASPCGDPFAGGELLEEVPFADPIEVPLDTKIGQGWDARRYVDLSELTPDDRVLANDRFFIRTERPDLITTSPEDWTIAVDGLVSSPLTLTMDDLSPLVEPMGTHVLECSGNGSGGGYGLLSAADWGGVPFGAILDAIDADPQATRVLVRGFDDHSVPSQGGHSTPGASWIFTFADLLDAGAFLATTMNGQPLPPDHGEPVRLLIPGWYGCCNIKWIDRIELVGEDAPATSQMMEFASRTHQRGVPELAADYIPATMDQAAMPVRVEKWLLDDGIAYRVFGVMWGGYALTDALVFSPDAGNGFEPVDVCPPQASNQTWTFWEHLWRPSATGSYRLRMQIDDASVPTRRLDMGWYDREVVVDEV